MKRRLDSLLQGGNDREAVAFAEKANLICRGAAFVAWDDAEKVAIAQDEVYQPSFDTELPQMMILSTREMGLLSTSLTTAVKVWGSFDDSDWKLHRCWLVRRVPS